MASSPPADPIVEALALARRGDLAGARRVAERAIAAASDATPLHALIGMLACRAGDFAGGLPHLAAAHDARRDDATILRNLVSALTAAGQPETALQVANPERAERDSSLQLWRVRAHLLQELSRFAEASDAYGHIVAAQPDDFESWNNLGNARAAVGDADGSVAALRRAVDLRPDSAPVRMNLAATLAATDALAEAAEILRGSMSRFPDDPRPAKELAGVLSVAGDDEGSLAALAEAARRDGSDVDLQLEWGMASVNAWRMEDAERAFHRVMELAPGTAQAYLLLALLYEHTNRAEQLPDVIATAEARGVDVGAIDFIRALDHRRKGEFALGLAAIERVPDTIEPVRRAHLAGQFHDRLGRPAEAFAAFTEMNRLQKLDPSEPEHRAAVYRTALQEARARVTPEWVARWNTAAPPPPERAAPVFLVGFPRSGTTLLDTLLMGHPAVQMLEERPPLRRVEQAIGALESLPDLDREAIRRARELYFEEAARDLPLRPDSVLVDKFPLHLNKVPLMHRIFPDALYILALRHPCDAVLSCFVTNFRLNEAMANFLDLDHAAWLYDQSFGFWEQSRALLPLRVHTVRYEDVVADSAAVLRPLFDDIGLDWQESAVDHRRTAAERGIISTASYAQVTEPIYQRAAGRWHRYREQLEPVLPVLRPWAERYGYAI